MATAAELFTIIGACAGCISTVISFVLLAKISRIEFRLQQQSHSKSDNTGSGAAFTQTIQGDHNRQKAQQ